MRLDLYLAENGFADSREKAKKLISAGLVTVNGKPVTKPSLDVGEEEVRLLADPFRFVGRGGEKLEAALRLFEIDPAGMRAADIGASTGGFTDCLLQHGAAFVTAVDVGCGQLHPKLANDPRVRNLEKYNARELAVKDIGSVDLAVMDVSFISATYIIPRVPELLTENGLFICLIKPQFEAGRAALNKQGVVKKQTDRLAAVLRVLQAAKAVGLTPAGLAPSPILGGDGNEEFLALFCKGNTEENREIPVEKVVYEKEVWR